jgi:hypothetical protein
VRARLENVDGVAGLCQLVGDHCPEKPAPTMAMFFFIPVSW